MDAFYLFFKLLKVIEFVQRWLFSIFTAKYIKLRKIFNILLRFFLSILVLLLLLWGFIHTDWGQNWLAHQVTQRLSRDLQSRISIKHVHIGLFNSLNLEDVLVEDQKKDTLVFAGKVEVRITDWFFLKDKAVLQYIGLENAVVKLQRTDSVWNYTFLEKYFASTDTTIKKKAGIEFNLKKVMLKNVLFLQKDGWVGQTLVAKIGGMDMEANDISLTQKNIDISSINFTKPYFQLYVYDGAKPETDTATHIPDTTSSLNPYGWTVNVNNIHITNGTFKNDRYNLTPTVAHFDGDHIDFHHITGQVKNVHWLHDTLRANITLSAKERSGLVVQSLKTDFRLQSELMAFNNLYLKTDKSLLKDYFAMHYASINSMNDFIHAVKMEGNFKDATISSDDIAFFAPEVKNTHKNIQVTGKVKGTVDALSADNLIVKAGTNTYLNGDVSLVGLPNIDETLINVQANELRTTYNDAVSFIPAIRHIDIPNLRKLHYLRFKGTYTGFINDFVTFGTIQTNLGTLVTDLNMKFPAHAPPVYSGHLSTNSFQLGQFINSNQLGMVAFNGDIKGRGFKWSTLDININGTIHKIQLNDYIYQNITAKGRISKQIFDGNFVIKDENADMQLSGIIDLSGQDPHFDVKADVAHANLQALQLTNENLQLSGLFNLNFTGNSLSSFLGDARISNATLLQNGKRLSFDSLSISSQYINNVKVLTVRSNELDATITGNFYLQELPDAFTHFLSHYYPAYIHHSYRPAHPQSFTFDIKTGVVEDYIRLIHPNLSGFNNSHITGSLDMAANTMSVNADVPQFSYDQYEFSDIALTGTGTLDSLILTGQIYNAIISDSLIFPQTDFTIRAGNDVSDISFSTTANQTLNRADLSARVKTFSDGVTILFNPSNFVLNGKTWTIEQGGELNFRNKKDVQGQLVLKESSQQIRLVTQPSGIGNWNDLHIALQNINLGDFSPFITKDMRIEGLLNGNIIIEDPQNKFNITSYVKTEQLRLDNDSIGAVQATVAYNNTSGRLTGSGNSMDPEHQILFNLDMDLKDTAHAHTDHITVKPFNYPVKILERFLGDLFSDMQGYITGQLDIVEDSDGWDYIGAGRLRDAGLKVNFTQVFYRIDDTQIVLKKDAIDLGVLKLRDRFGNTATVSGNIKHNGFSNMVFDIEAHTDSRPMELLNTSYNDNQQFYGRAMGTGTFTLRGPEYDMTMYINARPSDQDSSYITLPPSKSRESGTAGFMVEKKYGREMTEADYRGAATNITYEVDITANPMVNIQVILDELTGDVIRGRGVGNLNIKAGTAEPLSIRGRYDIQDGSYLFTFQSFFKKPFELKPGTNNYIEWTGDPYAANIHIEAVYKAEQVSFAPLASGVSALNSGIDISRYRGDVNVLVTLTGELFHPTFDFKLELPANSTAYNDPSLSFALQQIEKNTNEINKQVTYLIVFNSFAPLESAPSAGLSSAVSEFAYNTISGLFFGEINKRLNQLLGKVLRNNNLVINFTGSLYNRSVFDPTSRNFIINQSNLNLKIGRSFFNDRFIITFGSTFDVPLLAESNLSQNILFLPDVTAELLLNQSGTIRLTFFYRQNLDYLIGGTTAGALRTTRTGASITYRKEFNSLSQWLFGRKKGKLKAPLGPPEGGK